MEFRQSDLVLIGGGRRRLVSCLVHGTLEVPPEEMVSYLNWKLARSWLKVGLKTTPSRSIALETKVGNVAEP